MKTRYVVNRTTHGKEQVKDLLEKSMGLGPVLIRGVSYLQDEQISYSVYLLSMHLKEEDYDC